MFAALLNLLQCSFISHDWGTVSDTMGETVTCYSPPQRIAMAPRDFVVVPCSFYVVCAAKMWDGRWKIIGESHPYIHARARTHTHTKYFVYSVQGLRPLRGVALGNLYWCLVFRKLYCVFVNVFENPISTLMCDSSSANSLNARIIVRLLS
jgi:hypothetical protein